MTVGILGGGQLGRMLGEAGHAIGVDCVFYDPSPDACAQAFGELIVGKYSDEKQLRIFAEKVELITYEFENVPTDTVEFLLKFRPVSPPLHALATAQDRVLEKEFFRSLGVATAPFRAVENVDQLNDALKEIGTPSVLKTRRMGYDGKGQVVIKKESDAAAAWEAIGENPAILEGFVPFDRELSIIAVRGKDGTSACYPLVENEHRDGILRVSQAPAKNSAKLQGVAENFATLALDALNYVGVLAIELFEVSGKLLVNEMAPRVHNSGHWTIEGAKTSQFENHLRAVTGMPLGSTEVVGESVMVNIIGKLPDEHALSEIPGVHVHLYGKTERAGRKLGHVTLTKTASDRALPALLEKITKS
jgi:5-(carboxyamino)imidazole ribonucleotide synthase